MPGQARPRDSAHEDLLRPMVCGRAVQFAEFGYTKSPRNNPGSPWPGSARGCPAQLFAAATPRSRRDRHNRLIPLAGLVPATHIFECGCVDGREGVDGRAKMLWGWAAAALDILSVVQHR